MGVTMRIIQRFDPRYEREFMELEREFARLEARYVIPDVIVRKVKGAWRTVLNPEAMPKLRVMKDLEEYWIEINRLENDGDRAYRMLLVRLFSGEEFHRSLEM